VDMKARRPTLGRLLGDLRARNGWTLKEMSERTGIPVSTLSKVEHDRLTLTYDKLLQVSEGLKTPLAELLADPATNSGIDPAVTARRSLGFLADAVRVNTRNYDYYYMCPELRQKRMIPVIARNIFMCSRVPSPCIRRSTTPSSSSQASRFMSTATWAMLT
jgi:transcriptional regulator with XRE-family HTH domain